MAVVFKAQDNIRLDEQNTSEELKHNQFFNQLFAKEFERLEKQGHTYLDYTGGGLYGASQLEKHFALLKQNTFGNPHSTNPTSQYATALVEGARKAVIEYFEAYDYYCIFTQNASSAIKIIGESYPFGSNGQLLLLVDNHNSINGLRSYCSNRGGTYEYVALQEDLTVDATQLRAQLSQVNDTNQRLFTFPAQSNVSGVKHDLQWVLQAQQQGWDVLLDAAAFVPTSPLNLSTIQPDFVSLSFYKMFGYPTGVGCLLVKKSKFHKLIKPWFAGGTVRIASVRANYHFLENNHERFEDGTVDYLSLPAIKIGLDFINQIGIERINSRVTSLSDYLYRELQKIRHITGEPVVQVYGPTNRKEVGGTLAMNFYDARGERYHFQTIEHEANKRSISIRSGCFCNPGIDETQHNIYTAELEDYFVSHRESSHQEIVEQLGHTRGAVRVSVGIATRKQDLDFFLDFVHSFKNKTQ
ncbi:aminotransferase class V-fold PLP-dependent enzyme [Tunicatimonas pelagia]|uniref:aminotransferase class V-fold PLP-dependent enzyme n=1 Tax=Tunicatimonas pelagia TaxID=931531 RepID=UPI002665ACBA|nr:aminotransferase class V-fold PLP-dependent enzyme [Tunicatimonas pelagia]WKN45227.1 aminotransferase class V-fold PLP-dependent enzyme [Tunicatimonas pelagia]